LFPLRFLPAAIWRQPKDLLQIAIDHRTPDVWIQFRCLWCCSSHTNALMDNRSCKIFTVLKSKFASSFTSISLF
jgi:hypothetical protein